MTRLVYNASLLAGLLLVAVGAALQWGVCVALVLSGLLLLVLTVVGAVLGMRP